jgi:hypothetical protein
LDGLAIPRVSLKKCNQTQFHKLGLLFLIAYCQTNASQLPLDKKKYALVFTQKATAKEFMRDLQDPDLELEALETWVLKETYLTTLTLLLVSRVMFDYVQGQHNALSAPLELLRIHCQAQIRVVPRAVSA